MSETMVMANLDTGYFRFIAFGRTETDALNTMAQAWEAHAREYSDLVTYTWAELRDSVWFVPVGDGVALRDGDPMKLD